MKQHASDYNYRDLVNPVSRNQVVDTLVVSYNAVDGQSHTTAELLSIATRGQGDNMKNSVYLVSFVYGGGDCEHSQRVNSVNATIEAAYESAVGMFNSWNTPEPGVEYDRRKIWYTGTPVRLEKLDKSQASSVIEYHDPHISDVSFDDKVKTVRLLILTDSVPYPHVVVEEWPIE